MSLRAAFHVVFMVTASPFNLGAFARHFVARHDVSTDAIGSATLVGGPAVSATIRAAW